MIEKCAIAMTDWMKNCGAINKEDKKLYAYASQSFLLSISSLLLAIFLGICMGGMKQSLVLIIPFMTIRKFSGGYHARKEWTCLTCSSVLLLICISVSMYMQYNWVWLLFTILATASLIVFSPIDHEDRRLTQSEKRKYKRIVVILVFVFLVLVLFLFLIHEDTYVGCVSVGIILTAALQVPCVLKQAKRWLVAWRS